MQVAESQQALGEHCFELYDLLSRLHSKCYRMFLHDTDQAMQY